MTWNGKSMQFFCDCIHINFLRIFPSCDVVKDAVGRLEGEGIFMHYSSIWYRAPLWVERLFNTFFADSSKWAEWPVMGRPMHSLGVEEACLQEMANCCAGARRGGAGAKLIPSYFLSDQTQLTVPTCPSDNVSELITMTCSLSAP